MFIITGRREDVDMAKSEILQASEHFSNIRAQRKGVAPPPIQPGQITKTVSLAYLFHIFNPPDMIFLTVEPCLL